MVEPSGDQVGSKSRPPPDVRRRRSDPSAPITYTSSIPPENAILPSSAESSIGSPTTPISVPIEVDGLGETEGRATDADGDSPVPPPAVHAAASRRTAAIAGIRGRVRIPLLHANDHRGSPAGRD